MGGLGRETGYVLKVLSSGRFCGPTTHSEDRLHACLIYLGVDLKILCGSYLVLV